MIFAPKKKGQGLVEYALILVLVAVVIIAVVTLFGPWISGWIDKVNANLTATPVPTEVPITTLTPIPTAVPVITVTP